MELERLTEIIKTTKAGVIKKSLKKLGYIDCAKDKEMRHINLCDIMGGEAVTTEVFPTANGKREFYGDICTKVKGYEDLEFVIVNINKIYKDKDLSFPYKMFAFAKKVQAEVSE